MLPHSGFQFWNKSEDHRDSMSEWFSLRTTLRYVKICPSKCQTPSSCSFAFQAVRRAHYALHFTGRWKPHKAKLFLNTFQSHTRMAQSSQAWLMCDLNPNDLPELDCASCAYCKSGTNPFTSPLRGWGLQMKSLCIPQDHSQPCQCPRYSKKG